MERGRTFRSLTGLFACAAVAACAMPSNQVMVVNAPQAARPVQPAPVPNQPLIKGAESGKKQFITASMSINPDCTAIGYPSITVTKAPSNGQTSIEKGEQFPEFKSDNPRSVCNTRKLPATELYYTSNPGFTGKDSVAIEVLSPQGSVTTFSYVILVR